MNYYLLKKIFAFYDSFKENYNSFKFNLSKNR